MPSKASITIPGTTQDCGDPWKPRVPSWALPVIVENAREKPQVLSEALPRIVKDTHGSLNYHPGHRGMPMKASSVIPGITQDCGECP